MLIRAGVDLGKGDRWMPILVTGATGLLGNNVVRSLLERGTRVRVLVRETSDPRPLEGLPVERAEGDVRDVDAVRAACGGADVVIHCAAHVHIGRTGLDLQQAVNVEGTRCVAEAALAAGCRMVHVSTVDALGLGSRRAPADEQTPLGRAVLCPYVVTKRAAEQQVLQYVNRGLHAVIVNPGCMLGPWDWKPSSGRMLLEVARGRAFVAPRGVNSYCDVRDVTAGVLAAAERGEPGRRYILGGHSKTYFEAWQSLCPHHRRPPSDRRGGTRVAGDCRRLGRSEDAVDRPGRGCQFRFGGDVAIAQILHKPACGTGTRLPRPEP